MDISFIIACYNGEEILRKGIRAIEEIMSHSTLNYEIIFVDDKSTDNTKEIINKLIEGKENMKALFHTQNEGRGKTVADGIRMARGKYAGFVDIDLQTPVWYIPAMISFLEQGYDIASADRYYKLGKNSIFVFHRYLAHKVYRALVKLLFKTTLKDTETGFKFFRIEKILPLLDEIKDTKWFWDTEIMIRSYYRGLKIKEVPTIFLREGGRSTVSFFRDVVLYTKNLIAFLPEVKLMKKNRKIN